MNLPKKITNYINKYQMLHEGDRCMAAVSGGADSVCLLRILAELSEKMHFELRVVHVNHMIRGSEADRDEEFVVKLSEKLGVPCKVIKRPVPELAREWKMSLEEAGRKVRYEAFYDETRAGGVIATAHNRDDLAETVIYNMIRGTGFAGLKGISPVRENIIRPLLDADRNEIEEYLNDIGQTWCTDSTNNEDEYMRNRIRHNIIPELKNINNNATIHIAACAGDAADIADYMNEQIRICTEKYSDTTKYSISVPISFAKDADELIWNGMIREYTGKVCEGLKDIGRNHIEEINKLNIAPNGSSINLPNGAKVLRNNDRLIFYDRKMTEPLKEYSIEIDRPGVYNLPEGVMIPGIDSPYKLYSQITDDFVYSDLIKKEYTKYLDYDKISHRILLRPGLPEDYMVINDKGGTKKLNRIFTDNKLDEILRKRIPVIADGSRIIWIPGIRIGENYKINEETKEVLILKFIL